MTFETFKKIAESYRSDVRVSRHGDYCTNKSRNTLGIYFVKNGRESRVHNYYGSYSDILNKLGIPTITKADYTTAVATLERYREMNGEPKLFGDGVYDYSAEIERWEKLIAEYESDAFVRDWEVI